MWFLVILALSACGSNQARSGEDPSPSTETAAPAETATATETETETETATATETATETETETATATATEPDPPSAPDEISVAELLALAGSVSTSTGSPNDGALRGGVPLPATGPGLRSNPIRPNRDGYYGTVEMVQALVNAARVVDEELPGGELTVNDLSRREGGLLPHHGSHRAGRDVDVLFYYLDADGEPMRAKGVPVDPDGRGFDFGDLADPSDDVPMRIDVPRTWRFLQALVEEEHTEVQRIYLVEHVREMLLAHARRVRAPSRAIQRIDQMTCQPSHPHDDHMHIRFFCTAEDIREGGCEDTYPMYGWHRRAIRAEGETPVIARGRRSSRGEAPAPAMARTVSRQEARENAGPMHARVTAWLDRREEWADKPSPGRPYCP